jgi:molybdate transport system substrate-binding protein
MRQPLRSRSFNCYARISLLALLALAACKSEQPPPAAAPEPSPPAAAAVAEDQLVVFAAASLRDAFTTLSEPWKAAHPGVEVSFNFAGTQELRTQLEQGAPVDVFASADQRHMAELVKAGRATAPVLFARNEPVIVVAKEAAQTIHGLADLPGAARLVIGVPEVPIGRYTLQILDKAAGTLGADFRSKVESKVASRELNVRQVLNKVKLGEADAGFVYRSDAVSTPEVTVVAIPSELNVIAEYPIAVVSDAKHPKLAAAWVEHTRSEAGQRALQAAGFLPAEAPKP